MTLVEIEAADFDLARTLDSGQVFHWKKSGAGYAGAIGTVPVYVEQRGESLAVPAGCVKEVRNYFALDHSLAEIRASFPDDPVMRAASEFCRGLRIIRQPAWECIATFITSSMKQVAHIAAISLEIRRRWGRPLKIGAIGMAAYPSPGRLAEATEAELRECKLGFRAKNLLGAARMIAAGEVDPGRIAALDDNAAHAELCRLPGVGGKVANCALLFGFGRLAAFPIDVWIGRVLREQYFRRRRNVTPDKLREFAARHFGPYGGYAQQCLFHFARKRGGGL